MQATPSSGVAGNRSERHPSGDAPARPAARSAGAVLTATKLRAPLARPERVRRERLVSLIAAEPGAKLTLVAAPAGSGKTTVLSEWHSESPDDRRFAWLSLDPSDNDPTRFFEGVVAALRTVEPAIGAQALAALGGSAGLTEMVLPSLLNDLATPSRPLVLVLDDYHLVTSPRIHDGVTFMLDHLPEGLQLAVATRSDPPLPLARLRVRREIVEIRAEDLRFTDDEAAGLLNGILGLQLDPGDVARLQGRTEGWAAGLQLAALSLRGRADPDAFIASFAGDERQIVDYLGFEVLEGQPEAVRGFLRRTSILERLCGPLCDAVGGWDDSAERLVELDRANLFLLPLDGKREWYRYHYLFGELLRHELGRTEPEIVATLHARACEWFRERALITDAIHHAIASGDEGRASELITLHWYEFLQQGRLETVTGWLEALGDEVVSGDPNLCLTRAWLGVNSGKLEDVDRWIEAGERAAARGIDGRGADLEAGVASLREIHRYMTGDVGQAVESGSRAVERGDTSFRPVGCPVLGIALFWSGRPAEAATELEQAVRAARSVDNHLAVIHASGGLAALRATEGNLIAGDRLARSALELAEAKGLAEHWATTMSNVVRARALVERGRLEEASDTLDRGVDRSQRGVATVEIAYARLSRAEARHLRGDPDGARAVLREARRAVEACPDPGILRDMLAAAERRLRVAPRRRARTGAEFDGELTDRELAVLRLMPGALSLKEIGDALYVSRNTVKTHAKSIYRKLGVATRDEALRRAGELDLV